MLSAAFGGVLRDIIVNDVPLLFRAEVYALAALLGAGVYVGVTALGLGADYGAIAGALAAFGLRACAIVFNWSLPPIGRVD